MISKNLKRWNNMSNNQLLLAFSLFIKKKKLFSFEWKRNNNYSSNNNACIKQRLSKVLGIYSNPHSVIFFSSISLNSKNTCNNNTLTHK